MSAADAIMLLSQKKTHIKHNPAELDRTSLVHGVSHLEHHHEEERNDGRWNTEKGETGEGAAGPAKHAETNNSVFSTRIQEVLCAALNATKILGKQAPVDCPSTVHATRGNAFGLMYSHAEIKICRDVLWCGIPARLWGNHGKMRYNQNTKTRERELLCIST